jgi:hypothetical protein
MRRHICVFVALVGMCTCSSFLSAENDESNGKPIEIFTVTDSSNRSSTEMMSAFREKVASHSNLFSLVTNLDDSTGVVFDADCKTREKSNEAYVCFYTSYYAGGVVKTALGSGMYASKSADDVASYLLALMAKDVAEHWNSTLRSNALTIMESCLSAAKFGCSVPVPLTPEFRSRALSLAQSLHSASPRK